MTTNETPTAAVSSSPAAVGAGSGVGSPATLQLGNAAVGSDQPARPAARQIGGSAAPLGHGGSIGGNGAMSNGDMGTFANNVLPNLDEGGSTELRRIIVASDHRGYAAKCRLLDRLRSELPNHEVVDFGCNDGSRACDYPDYAIPAATLVASGEYDAAILLDGSGIGMGIAANKVRGIRAATCHDEITARIAREHNHCNALCVGVDLVGEKTLFRVVKTFLDTAFSGGRHVRRVAKLCAHEDESFAAESEQQQQQLLRRAGC